MRVFRPWRWPGFLPAFLLASCLGAPPRVVSEAEIQACLLAADARKIDAAGKWCPGLTWDKCLARESINKTHREELLACYP